MGVKCRMVQQRDSPLSDTMEVTLTKQKHELLLRKPICPYICSTQDDFEEERAFLHQKIFPNIDAFCKQRGTHFSPVDIPWSTKDSQVQLGHLLPLCLESITNCMPYFICMLGEKYGPSRAANTQVLPKAIHYDYMEKADWLEKNYILSAFGGHKWVLEEAHQFSSFTELQIIQAAFLGSTEFCNFYFRQPEHVDTKGTHLPASTRSKYLRRFDPEDEYSALKIRDLKQRIVNKGLAVKYFRTLEDLGNLIVNDWTAVIDLLLPPMFDDDHYFTSAGYIEWQAHESFAESRRQLYSSTPEIKATMRSLTEFAVSCLDEPVNEPIVESFTHRAHSFSKFLKKKETVPSYRSTLVLTGDRGSGKTTILSNWLQDFSEEYPHVPVIRHFVGCNSHSTDISIFLQHCTQILREQYSDLGDCDSKMAATESIQLQSFPEYVEAFLFAAGLGPCVLVLDGIDELSGTNGISPREVKNLSWLPVPLPPQCRLIVSTTQSDLTYKALAKRSDAIILSVPSLASNQFKISFLEDSMDDHFPHLNRENIKQVLELDMSSKPLFLDILSGEMKCFSVYSKLSAFLEAAEEISTLRAFWSRSLHRWIREYSWTLESIATDSSASVDDRDFIGWLPDMLRLLVMSRDGLRQSELLDLLEVIGYNKDTKVTPFHWLLFRQNLGAAIYEKPDGRLTFSHQHVKEIIEYLLLRSVQRSGAESVPKSSGKKVVKNEKQVFHSHLAQYFLHQPHSWRRTLELPWQLMMAGDLEMLSKVIHESQIFMQLVDEKDQKNYKDLICYCEVLRKNGADLEGIFMQMLTSNELASLPDKMQSFMFDGPNFREENHARSTPVSFFTPVIPRILTDHASDLSIEDEGIYLTEVDWSASKDDHVAPEPGFPDQLKKRSVGKQREPDMSLAIISDKLSSSLSSSAESLLPEEPSMIVILAWQCAKLSSCLGFASTAETIYIALSEHLSKNYPLLQEEQLIHIRIELALGYLYKKRGDKWRTEHAFDKALSMISDMYDVSCDASSYRTIQYLKGELSCCIGTLHMEAGDLYKAEDMLKEALEMVDQGRNMPIKATILLSLGRLRLKQEDFVRAETALQKSLILREQLYGTSHPQVAEVLHSLAGLICHSANQKGYVTQDGELLYRRELEIRQRFLGKDHILVAATLVELGLLMKKDSSLSAKTEAVMLLKEALDIRTTKLGGDHSQTKGVRTCLTNLEVAIKLGHYEFGRARPSDNRTLERPYSSMSWRDKAVASFDNKAKRSLSRCSKTPSDINRPFSKDSELRRSGTESQASVPMDRENQIDGRMRLLNRETTQSKIRSMSAVQTEESTWSKAPKKHVTISIKLDNSNVDEEVINPPPPQDLHIESYADNTIAPQRPKGVRTLRTNRPLSAPFRLHQRFGSAGSCASSPAFKPIPKRSRSRAGSGRSSRMTMTSFYSEASCGSHKMNCDVPGSDSVLLADAQTVHGPHSTLTSLLGPAPCPRNKPNVDHHKAAWYHVPGRYQTKEMRYPPKRNQIRPDIRNLQANMMIDALRQKDEQGPDNMT